MTEFFDFLVKGLIFVGHFFFMVLAFFSLGQLLDWLAEQWKRRTSDHDPGPFASA